MNLVYCLADNLSLKLGSDTKVDHKNSEKKIYYYWIVNKLILLTLLNKIYTTRCTRWGAYR